MDANGGNGFGVESNASAVHGGMAMAWQWHGGQMSGGSSCAAAPPPVQQPAMDSLAWSSTVSPSTGAATAASGAGFCCHRQPCAAASAVSRSTPAASSSRPATARRSPRRGDQTRYTLTCSPSHRIDQNILNKKLDESFAQLLAPAFARLLERITRTHRTRLPILGTRPSVAKMSTAK